MCKDLLLVLFCTRTYYSRRLSTGYKGAAVQQVRLSQSCPNSEIYQKILVKNVTFLYGTKKF